MCLYDKYEPEFYVLSLIYLIVKMVAVLSVFVIIYLGTAHDTGVVVSDTPPTVKTQVHVS